MSTGSHPNFFLLLGLDPRAPWNQTAFELRLKEKNSEWARASSGIGNPAREAKQRIELIPEIKDVMGDDDKRAVEAAAALVEADRERKELLDQFEETLRIGVAKGHVKQSELAAWAKTYASVLTEADIRKRIAVPIQEDAPHTTTPTTPQLDPIKAKGIQDRLDTLGVSDLYALLSMPALTDTETLLKKARSLNAEFQRNMNKTIDLTTRIELLGSAMDVFKSDDMRSRYDETLRMAGFEAILRKYDQAFRAAGEVDERQAALFLQEARATGMATETALARLKALASQRKWAIRVGGAEVISQQQVCGSCRALNDSSADYCNQCAAQLKLRCPQCDHVVASDARACQQCGFPVGNRYLVDSLVEESQRQRTARRLDEALLLIASAEQAWPNHISGDQRAQRLHKERLQVEDLRQQQIHTVERLRRLTDTERKYFEARALLDGLEPDSIPDQEAFKRQSDDVIRHAQRLLAQAREKERDSDSSVELVQEALHICADYQEARDLLANHPPDPPTHLTAQAGENLYSLRWQPSPTHGLLRYRVIRKSGAPPVSAQDGELLEIIGGLYYTDNSPVVGVPLFYAVFTDREGVPSIQGVPLSQPVMLTPPVAHIVTQVNDRLVELSWRTPANVRRVLITRNVGAAPHDLRDGTPLTALDLHHLTDRGVRNETTYFYRIVCQYVDASGAERLSPAVVTQATPQIPPAPIRDFTIENQQTAASERVATLRWAAPTKGKAVVLKSPQSPALSVGAIIPEDQLRDFGAVLEGRSEALSDRWSREGACVYTLVVVFQGMAYIGASQPYAAVDDVSNLQARNLGATIRLTWMWPSACERAVVVTSAERWPSRRDATASVRSVERATYERAGYFELPGSHGTDLFIVICAEMRVAGATVYAPGTASDARTHLRVASRVSLAYEIRRVKPLFGAARLVLQLRPGAATTLPTMIIRCKQYGLPFNKTDGEFVTRVGPYTSPIATVDVELEAQPYAHDTFGKLFLEDDSAYEIVEVNHPDREQLRLNG